MKPLLIAASMAAAAGILAFPAATSSAHTGVTSDAPEEPAGRALVSVAGPSATATKIGHHRYKLVVPRDVDIDWFGENQKGDLALGSFTAKGLGKAWSALGHRKDRGVPVTMNWQLDGGQAWVVGLVTNPRTNSDGHLVLTVTSPRALPAQLLNFRVTITRPKPTGRAFTIYGPAVAVTGGVSVSADASSATSSQSRLYYGSTKCFTVSHSVGASNAKAYFTSANCNGVIITDGSFAQITGAGGTSDASGCTSTSNGQERYSLQIKSGKNTTTMNLTPLQWDFCGNKISP